MEIRLLGPIEVEDAGELLPLPRPREQCLLGIMAMDAGRPVPAERLADLLWEGAPPGAARAALHTYVSRLRAALPASAPVRRARSGYVLDVDPSAVDALRFRATVRDLAAEPEPGRRAVGLRAVLDLWRGPVMSGVATEWLRHRLFTDLDELRLTATEDWLAAELARGNVGAAAPVLARLAAEHPTRERLVELAMRALGSAGRRADALALFRRTRRVFVDELGIEPGVGLERLHRSLLGPDPVHEEVPAPDRRWVPLPRMLPRTVGHFVGRGAELAGLDALLADGDQLAVLTGAGGVGKTSLAVHWGRRVADRFPDGHLFVDLRGADGHRAVPAADALAMFLRALGVPPDRVPADPAEGAALYRSLLTARRVLVVLDNAAGSDQIDPLLPGAPTCAVLVTSRRRLPALATRSAVVAIELGMLAAADGVDLVSRMVGPARVRREPDSAAELVRLCGGLPLAVRIAAADLATRPDRPIGRLVDDLADERGRLDVLATEDTVGVRAAFAGSYRSLSPATRRVFRLVGTHPGREFTTESIAAMGGLPDADTMAAIAHLVAAHLAHESAPSRYTCHDLVRLYAGERAEDDPPERRTEAVARLVDRYRTVAADAWQRLGGAAPAVSDARFPRPDLGLPDGHDGIFAWTEREWDTMAAAVRCAPDHGLAGPAWELAWLLSRVAHLRGFHRYLDVAAAGLAAARMAGDREGEARLALRGGLASASAHRFDEALDRLRHAADWYAEAGSVQELGTVWGGIGFTHYRRHDSEAAVAAYLRSVEHAELAGDRVGIGVALNNLGSVCMETGDLDGAAERFERALDVLRAAGSRQGEGLALLGLGELLVARGDLADAVRVLTDAIALYGPIGDRIGELAARTWLTRAHLAGGALPEAMAEVTAARALAEAMGDSHSIAGALVDLALVQLAGGGAADARRTLADAAALRRHLPDVFEEARLERAHGDLAAYTGRPADAARHWRAALDRYRQGGANRQVAELTRRLGSGGPTGSGDPAGPDPAGPGSAGPGSDGPAGGGPPPREPGPPGTGRPAASRS